MSDRMTTAQGLKRGSWRAIERMKVGGEPLPQSITPTMPPIVSEDPYSQALWDRLLPAIERMGVCTEVDGEVFGRYCVIMAEWVKCTQNIRQNGSIETYIDKMGNECERIRAVSKRERELAGDLSKLEQLFGLSPLSRTRLRVEPAQAEIVQPSREEEQLSLEKKSFFDD